MWGGERGMGLTGRCPLTVSVCAFPYQRPNGTRWVSPGVAAKMQSRSSSLAALLDAKRCMFSSITYTWLR